MTDLFNFLRRPKLGKIQLIETTVSEVDVPTTFGWLKGVITPPKDSEVTAIDRNQRNEGVISCLRFADSPFDAFPINCYPLPWLDINRTTSPLPELLC